MREICSARRSKISPPLTEQRKTIKYNHLVANLLIFHTIVGMTNALDAIIADGHHGMISDEALAGLSPYQTEHINRFGDYVLDLNQPPAPLPFALPARSQPLRMPSPGSV
jgi:hypothetical protein